MSTKTSKNSVKKVDITAESQKGSDTNTPRVEVQDIVNKVHNPTSFNELTEQLMFACFHTASVLHLMDGNREDVQRMICGNAQVLVLHLNNYLQQPAILAVLEKLKIESNETGNK